MADRAATCAARLTPSRRAATSAHGGGWRGHPSPGQALHALRMMPADMRVARRDRAILAALPPTGARADLASRRHVPPEAFKVWSRNSWPRGRADPLAASETQRNLCAPALVDELRRFRAFRLRMQDMASRMAERQAAEGPALRLLDGGRGDA